MADDWTWCEDCDLTYRAKDCPACPARDRLKWARAELAKVEPVRVLNDSALNIESYINALSAQGFQLTHFEVGTEYDAGEGTLSAVAVMQRGLPFTYDRDRHARKIQKVSEAQSEFFSVRDEHAKVWQAHLEGRES